MILNRGDESVGARLLQETHTSGADCLVMAHTAITGYWK